MSADNTYTITDTHPDHGKYTVEFHRLPDGQTFVLHPPNTGFDTDDADAKDDCLDAAEQKLRQRTDSDDPNIITKPATA